MNHGPLTKTTGMEQCISVIQERLLMEIGCRHYKVLNWHNNEYNKNNIRDTFSKVYTNSIKYYYLV